MKRALVLSGGGARGAFQVGALQYVEEVVKKHPDFLDWGYDYISGVSVGALNGFLLAQDQYDVMYSYWDTLENEDVYEGKFNVASAAVDTLLSKRSVLNNKPLLETLLKLVDIELLQKTKTRFEFGVVHLETGRYINLSPHDFDDRKELVKAILASTAQPIIWEPVDFHSSTFGPLNNTLDGGLRDATPLRNAIEQNPDEIIIITCNKVLEEDERAPFAGILDIALRCLTKISVNEIFRSDIDGFLHINHILSHLPLNTRIPRHDDPTKSYKYFKSILIEPSEPLGDNMEFGGELKRKRMALGYAEAKKQFEAHYPQLKDV